MSEFKIVENNIYSVEKFEGEEVLTRVASERHKELIGIYKESVKRLEEEIKQIQKLEKELTGKKLGAS